MRRVACGGGLELPARTSPQSPLGSFSRRGGGDDGATPPRTGCSYSWGLEIAYGGEGPPLRLPGSPRDGRLGRAVRLRPPPERDRAARRLPGPQLLPGRRGGVWIITEADRSITTILLPEEY